METPDWVLEAKCRKLHGDFWFPPEDVEDQQPYYDIARVVCASCPVWEQCLEAGKKEIWGMWGGLTPKERIPFRAPQKVKHLAETQTFVRFRQGSTNKKCAQAHKEACDTPYDLSVVPGLGESYNLKKVHSKLFESLDTVK